MKAVAYALCGTCLLALSTTAFAAAGGAGGEGGARTTDHMQVEESNDGGDSSAAGSDFSSQAGSAPLVDDDYYDDHDDDREPGCGGMFPFTCTLSGGVPVLRWTPGWLMIGALVGIAWRRRRTSSQ